MFRFPVLSAFAVFALHAARAEAAKRMAPVIGKGEYGVSPVANPSNDTPLTGDCNSRINKGSRMLNHLETFLPKSRQAVVGEWPHIYGGLRVARDLN